MPEKLYPYSRFVGLDAIADRRQMGERFLEVCESAFVDLRGQINKLPGHKLKPTSAGTVGYCEHYGEGVVLYGANNTSAIDFHTYDEATSTIISGASTTWAFGTPLDWVHYLNKEYVLVGYGAAPLSWDGAAWTVENSWPADIRGEAGATLMSRLVTGAYGPNFTEIAVTKAGAFDFTVGAGAGDGARFDIRDDLTAKDRIKGLGVFEGNKLAIFCQNETLLYVADPDINNWQLLRDFRVPIGCIGKRTIKRVGNDLFFASKFGVHSIRRALNGITLESITFSRVVQDIYFQCLQRLPPVGQWEPRAVWDPNKGHYHLFMPQVGDAGPGGLGVYWSRFTFTIEPSGRQPHLSWGFTPNSGWSDGTYFNGKLVLAVYSVGLCDDDMRYETDTSRMRARTAVLYQGSPQREKNYKRLLVRASGDAKFKIRAFNQDLELLEDDLLSTYPDNDGSFYTPERPLDLPFEHRAYGVQLEFISEDIGDCRIMDFAIVAE